MDNVELIQQARELCEKRLTGINKYHGSIATKSSRCGDGVYDSIIERLYHFEYDIVPQLCDALVAMTARAEKTESELSELNYPVRLCAKVGEFTIVGADFDAETITIQKSVRFENDWEEKHGRTLTEPQEGE